MHHLRLALFALLPLTGCVVVDDSAASGDAAPSEDAAYVDVASPSTDAARSDARPTDAGAPTGSPIVVAPTTTTTPIPTVAKCSGATLVSKGDVPAIDLPVFVGGDRVESLTLRYVMDTYFGEPTRKAVISWDGTGSLGSLQWLAEVQDLSGRQYVNAGGKRVYASYNLGSILGPGKGFGTDSTGSPSWSNTFVTYDGAVTEGTVSDVDAKNIYKACFKLANVRVLKLNGKAALRP